jgi:choline-sulfatase
VPQGAVVRTPVSLVDLYRTALEGTGCPVPPEDEKLPSYSLWEIARGAEPDRTVLSEYHAVASITGTFMIRHGKWKYIHHAGYRPELFDLESDRGETRDLAGDPAFAPVLAECEAALRRILDPDAVTAAAFADQARKIAEHGGRAAILARGDFGYTPAPGETPAFA